MGTAAWLVISVAGNQLPASSPSRRRLIWHEEALLALALATPLRASEGGPPWAYLRNGPKRASRNCILQRETVLGEQISAPMRLGSGSQRLPSSPLAQGFSLGEGGSGLPLAPWALLLVWWSPQLEINCKRLLPSEEG